MDHFDKYIFKYVPQFEKRNKSPRHFVIETSHDGAERGQFLFSIWSLEDEELMVFQALSQFSHPLVNLAVSRSTLTEQINLQILLLNIQLNSSSSLAGHGNQPGNIKKENQRSSDLILHGSRMGSMCILSALQGVYWEVSLRVYRLKLKAEVKCS